MAKVETLLGTQYNSTYRPTKPNEKPSKIVTLSKLHQRSGNAAKYTENNNQD